MAKVKFRNKTTEALATFVGLNGWQVVEPGDVIEVDDDDVVTPASADGELAAVSSADSYRAASEQWDEVGATPPTPGPVPPAAPAVPVAEEA